MTNDAITPTFEYIDVETARRLLRNAAPNRPLIKACLDRLERDMKMGRYSPTHQAIGIDTLGRTFDGQHRLHAIINSGKGQWMVVCRNVPVAAVHVTDIGRGRQLLDILHIAGSANVVQQHVAIARYLAGGAISKPTNQEVEDFLLQNWEGIDFAVSALPKGNKRSSVGRQPVAAVIARAYYSQDHARLRRFCTLLMGELPDEIVPGDQTPNCLGRAIAQAKGAKTAQLYWKSEAALVAFLAGRDLKLVHPRKDEERFPLPTEIAECGQKPSEPSQSPTRSEIPDEGRVSA